jgi:hypothetical protein
MFFLSENPSTQSPNCRSIQRQKNDILDYINGHLDENSTKNQMASLCISGNKISRLRGQKRDGGRWGVAPPCKCRTILDVIATLIEAQHPDLPMVLIRNELNSQT